MFYTKMKNKLLISLGIIFLLASIVYAGTTLTVKQIAVSDKNISDTLGKVKTTDYTCDSQLCHYEIERAGRIDTRYFNSTKDNEKAFEEDVVSYYEDIIARIKNSQELLNQPTKEIITTSR